MRNTATAAIAGLLLVPALSGARAAGAGAADGVHLVPLDAMRVPIIDGDRADGMLQVKLVLVTADADAAQHARAAQPVLRAISVAAAVEFARLHASPAMPVDAARLAADMTAALRRQDPHIVRVLVVEVAARRA